MTQLRRWLNQEVDAAPLSGWRWRAGAFMFVGRRLLLAVALYTLVDLLLPSSVENAALTSSAVEGVAARWCPYGKIYCTKVGCGGQLVVSCRPLGLVNLYVQECGVRYHGDAFPGMLFLFTVVAGVAKWRRLNRLRPEPVSTQRLYSVRRAQGISLARRIAGTVVSCDALLALAITGSIPLHTLTSWPSALLWELCLVSFLLAAVISFRYAIGASLLRRRSANHTKGS